MTRHTYYSPRPYAERLYRRMLSVAEINILRKFEGKKQIEERISRQLGKLHSLYNFKHTPTDGNS